MDQDARARDLTLELAARTKHAVHSPSTFMTDLLVQQQQYTCLSWLVHFDVLTRIPLPPASISYPELAGRCGVPEGTLKAVARMVMTMGFLCETAQQEVAHNPLSGPFVENRDLMTWLLQMVNHTVPFMRGYVEATERWGHSEKVTETAFNVARATDLSFFAYLKSHPDVEASFDAYMQSQSKVSDGARVEHLLDGFDWKSLREGALVVDCGGGSGTTSLVVARAFPTLRFVLQDQATPIENARRQMAKASREAAWDRFEVQVHDFFAPQPIVGADVYLLRMIIHDWPDAESAAILGRIARAMRPHSRLLIMDMVVPMPGTGPVLKEASLREKDLVMRQVFNAKERETADWHGLIRKVSPPMRIKDIKSPHRSQHSVIEVVLEGDGGQANGSLANGAE
ncbi:O-methyltransferase-domain-containing protein [Xylariomycetidae sp. FL2044]|nr:O-methyltransferase-domain-containing protein [Xylariomycetidae sp. FL2044]